MSLQDEIDAIAWYHEFDFGNGLVARSKTAEASSHRSLWRFIESELERIDVRGKTVLDIGCWDGYWSFYAERRGAAHVLATDDSSQNRAGNSSGLQLARRLLRSNVEVNADLSVYQLDKLGRTFDVILFPGVYYHLLDPFYAFAQVRHCCHAGSVVVIEGDAYFNGEKFGPQTTAFYADDPRTAPRFVPQTETLRRLLRAAYFTIEYEAGFQLYPPHIATSEIWRIPEGTNRMLVICRPLSGENSFHIYRPPFGLAAYDSRWHAAPT